ncbi:MAG: ribonuclease Z [Acidimicrobiales bacterium]
MSTREIVMLGTASQSPTRHRNHNGYALRWDDRLVFFDPGEGFQRQCTMAGIAIARADAVCLTHFHGDHCLGVPGLIARRGADQCTEPLAFWYPGDGQDYFDKLATCTASMALPPLDPRPIMGVGGPVGSIGSGGAGSGHGALTVTTLPLRHRVTAFGYRLQEPDGRSFDPAALAARGISGPDVGRLASDGWLDTADGRVTLEEVSSPRKGQSMAFVMDTAVCDSIVELADGVDLLVIESTFLHRDAELAEKYRHLTARQAGELGAAAGARRVVLTHFSQRYGSGASRDEVLPFVEEASAFHGDVWGALDFDVVEVPPRV